MPAGLLSRVPWIDKILDGSMYAATHSQSSFWHGHPGEAHSDFHFSFVRSQRERLDARCPRYMIFVVADSAYTGLNQGDFADHGAGFWDLPRERESNDLVFGRCSSLRSVVDSLCQRRCNEAVLEYSTMFNMAR
jgi:hypothetical protein